jgi:hypothetical protein
MTFVIMAMDECGFETSCGHYETEQEARDALPEIRERFVEYRRFWVELLKDSAYFREHYAERFAQGFDHPEDIYGDREY